MNDKFSLERFEQYIIKNKGLTMICSRPEFGRFEMINQLAEKTNEISGKKTILFSLEMTKYGCSRFLGYPPKYIIIDKYDITEIDIQETILQYENVSYIFIDYIELLSPQLIARLSELANETGVHFIVGSALSRACADLPEHKPTLAFFEEFVSEHQLKYPTMKSIDMLAFLWRPHKCKRGIGIASAYSLHSQGDVIIAKNNFGLTGHVKVTYKKKRHRFV